MLRRVKVFKVFKEPKDIKGIKVLSLWEGLLVVESFGGGERGCEQAGGDCPERSGPFVGVQPFCNVGDWSVLSAWRDVGQGVYDCLLLGWHIHNGVPLCAPFLTVAYIYGRHSECWGFDESA